MCPCGLFEDTGNPCPEISHPPDPIILCCPYLTSQLEILDEVDPPALHVKHAGKTEQLLSVLRLRCFSLVRRHLFHCSLSEEQFGLGGPMGLFQDMNLQYTVTP